MKRLIISASATSARRGEGIGMAGMAPSLALGIGGGMKIINQQ